MQVLGPLQRGGHEQQEGPVYAMNGGQVTPAADTDSCFSLGVRRWWRRGGGEVTGTHILSDGQMGGRTGREGVTHTRTHCAWHWDREVGLTIDFHMKYVIFVVTGAVGTEAKALDFPCGREKRGASVRVHSPRLWGWKKEAANTMGLLPAPSPACLLSAPSLSSSLPCCRLLLSL